MNTAAYVDEQIKVLKSSGIPLSDAAWQLALLCVGWPYVFGDRGQYCTPANRRAAYNRTAEGKDKDNIKAKCYYYKDYGSVRVIILNAMSGDDSVTYWDANAKTWLEAVLADAKTNSKHVLCINHTPFTATDRVLNTDSQWTSFKPYFDAMVLEPEAVSAVQSFITSGGIFIGWLVGHSHTDEIMKNNNGQFMFASATAHYANDYFHADGYGSNNVDDETYNCFNLCGIDTTNKIFKMVRIGWNMDSSMRKRNSFSYDYQNKEILSDRG